MRDAAGLDGFTAHAVARWETLVRVAVLLGVPPSAARELAEQAVVRARDAAARAVGARDPDVELFGALLDAHRADRRPWWGWTPTGEDLAAREPLAEVGPALDRLGGDVRARVVLEAVALLAPEQLDEVVPDDGPPAPAGLVARARAAAGRLEVAGRRPGGVAGSPVRTTTRRSLVSGAAVLLAVVLAGLAGLSAASQLGSGTRVADGPPPGAEAPGTPTDQVGTVALDGPVPLAWYAAGVVHLGAREVPVAGVVSLAVLPDGVVATTRDRRIVLVLADGEVRQLARLAPGARVATSRASGYVAYLEPGAPRAITVYDSVLGDVRARVPVDQQADVAAVDATATYVNDGDGHLVVDGGDEARRTNGITVLDAAGGVLAVAAGTGAVQVLRDGELLLTSAGDDVELSSGGRYALVSTEGDRGLPPLLEVAGGEGVPIDLDAGVEVRDASFADDDTLVLAVRAERPSRLPVTRGGPSSAPRRTYLLTCAVAGPAGGSPATCERSLRVDGDPADVVLAR